MAKSKKVEKADSEDAALETVRKSHKEKSQSLNKVANHSPSSSGFMRKLTLRGLFSTGKRSSKKHFERDDMPATIDASQRSSSHPGGLYHSSASLTAANGPKKTKGASAAKQEAVVLVNDRVAKRSRSLGSLFNAKPLSGPVRTPTPATDPSLVPGTVGMPNWGNTCYMNSILQCPVAFGLILEASRRPVQ